MLPAGHVAPDWDVQGRVCIEEAKGLQEEADMLSRHDRPVLNPGDVSHPKGVPDDTVSLHQVPVLQKSAYQIDACYVRLGDVVSCMIRSAVLGQPA